MKRSEINREIKKAEAFFASFNFKLPKFASWTLEDWDKHGDEIQEIFDCELGWDLTDFGRGDFAKDGLLLFTIRNGIMGSEKYSKPYAEKLMISRSEQVTLMHCHVYKQEDIINRGGGRLVFELYNRKGDTLELDDTPVELVRDGEKLIIPAGGKLILEPGVSIGTHTHENEEEIFLVLQGQAKVTDNGVEAILESGDSIITRHGDNHSVACHGDETLVLLAAILPY